MTRDLIREQRRQADARQMRDRNAATNLPCHHDLHDWTESRDLAATPGAWVECENCGATREVNHAN